MYTQTYSNLSVCSLDPEQHARTCNYWYTVRNEPYAHTAFNKRSSLMRWLEERGLELVQDLPEQGTHSYQRIEGQYRTAMHMSYDEFYALDGLRTRALSNGQWTMAVVTTDEEGIRTVHTLNPNCKDRPVYDYSESRVLFG